MGRLARRLLRARLIELDRGGCWSWVRFGIWTLRLKEFGRVYLVQVMENGLVLGVGVGIRDKGWSSVVDGGSGVYN
jgi:hypothetical protein